MSRLRLIWIALAGVTGGVLGGMGLGGGTLLIPLLTLWLDVPQKLAAWLNLVTFVPMSVVALAVHAKNGYVDKKNIIFTLPFAAVSAGVCAYFSTRINADAARFWFGIFLLSLGSVFMVVNVVKQIKSKCKNRVSKHN